MTKRQDLKNCFQTQFAQPKGLTKQLSKYYKIVPKCLKQRPQKYSIGSDWKTGLGNSIKHYWDPEKSWSKSQCSRAIAGNSITDHNQEGTDWNVQKPAFILVRRWCVMEVSSLAPVLPLT